MSGWDGDPGDADGDRGEPTPPPESHLGSVARALLAIAVLAGGLFASWFLLVAVGLSATGVGAGAGPMLACAPFPTILAVVLAVVLMVRRGR
jgi:hypothetical protein